MTLVPSAPSVEPGTLDAVERRRNTARAGAEAMRLAASLVLHLALFAAALLAGVRTFREPADAPALETEIISSRDFAALRAATQRLPPPPPSSADATLPSGAASAPASAASPGLAAKPAGPPDMVRPSQMLSEQALGHPRSRGLRRELGRLVEEDRIAQLCNLEAMEQIHAWRGDFQPDRLVDYARSDTRMDGRTLIAHGGAFRSARNWYEVSYQCELDPELSKVVGFAFHVGAAIPREEWAADNLPALH